MDGKYTLTFNAITDAIAALEKLRDFLIAAQQQAEEMYISSESES